MKNEHMSNKTNEHEFSTFFYPFITIIIIMISGNLCGLMPDTSPNSEQLHRVVELSSGIRDDHYVRSNVKMKQNPVDKLKEALSSKSAFQKYYLVI